MGIAGYSLGAYMSVFVASSHLVRAVALVAGGDLPEFTPFERAVRAAADPRRAAKTLRHFEASRC